MKQFIYNSLIGFILLFGSILLLGKFHYLLGSLLWLFQVPLMLIGGLILWRRRKTGFKKTHKFLGLIVGLLLINFLFEHFSRINFQRTTNTNQELSILTYNLYFKNKYPKQIINEINQTNPDILVLQELTSTWETNLQEQVYKRYKYRKTYVNNRTHGLGILSKYPITTCEYLKNKSGIPVSQVATVQLGKKELVLVNTHLASPAIAVENPDQFFKYYKSNVRNRTHQWTKLNAFLTQKHKDKPQLIAGDLNTMKIEPLYQQMRHDWNYLFTRKGKGFGWNFPNVSSVPIPLITLDYLLYRGNIAPVEAEVLKGSSSDHFAILGKVKI